MRRQRAAARTADKLHKESAETMLLPEGKELIQSQTGRFRPYLWCAVSGILLLLECGGLLGMAVSGWCLPADPIWWIPALILSCLLFTGFYRWDKLEGKRRYGVFLFTLVYASVLFLTQDAFTSGAKQFLNAAVSAANQQYRSSVELFSVSGSASDLNVFLAELTVLLAFVLGAVTVWRPDALVLAVIEFPLLAVFFLFACSPSILPLFALMFAALGVLAASRSWRRRSLWGGDGSEQRRRNLECFENVQKKVLLVVGSAAFLLSISAFYLVSPVLSVQLEKAESAASRIETGIMEQLLGLLPQTGAGSILMTAETEGRGVQDGALGDTDGYAVGSLEDLKVTVSEQPAETVYLKGFIGSSYGSNRWQGPSEEHFKSAAMNWRTEDDPMLYIQNLPFLRTMYAQGSMSSGQDVADQPVTGEPASGQQAAEMTVERLNASSEYTYVPYNAYLNEYYELSGGDGAVLGQDVQDDIFPFYAEADCSPVLEAWDKNEENSSVLDRTEASYDAYTQQRYLEVPDGLEDLQAVCAEQDFQWKDEDEWMKEQGLVPEELEKIENFVITYLNEHYTYDIHAGAVPEGEDFLRYFLEESKTGYSTHFATAAVVMFRMCGVPARYVAGYAAPAELFTAQPDGTYTAVLQADNSHAWAEVYEPGIGWKPVETTPGALGTKQEVEMPRTDQERKDPSAADESDSIEPGLLQKLTAFLSEGNLSSVIVLMEISVLVLGAAGLISRRVMKRRIYLGKKKKAGVNENIRNVFCGFYELLLYAGLPESVHSDDPDFCEKALQICAGSGRSAGGAQQGCETVGRDEIAELYMLTLRAVYGREQCGGKELIKARKISGKAAASAKRGLRPAKRIRAFLWEGF